jgi:hypothetical protein
LKGIKKVDFIKNEKDVKEFYKSTIAIPFPMEGPYYNFIIQENFNNTDHTLLIMHFSHTIIDGNGIVTLLSEIMDNFDRKVFINYRTYKPYHKFISFFLYPMFFIENTLMTLITLKWNNNPFGRETEAEIETYHQIKPE